MVTGLDDVTADVFTRVEHIRLALVLGVAREKKGVAAVVHAQNEALVVDVAVVLLWAEDVTVAPPRAKVSPTPGTVMVRFAVSAARMTRWNAPLLLEVTEL